jgi:hypothetical protein
VRREYKKERTSGEKMVRHNLNRRIQIRDEIDALVDGVRQSRRLNVVTPEIPGKMLEAV